MVGEKGTIGRTTSPEMVNVPTKPIEQPVAILEANTQDILYLFAADGQAVSLPVYQLAQVREMGQGKHWSELTSLTRRSHLAAALVIPPDAEGYLFLTTLAGVVKKVKLEDLPGISTDAFTVIHVQEDDALGWAKITTGEDEVMLASASGQLIRFKEDSVRSMGLPAGGVMGIKLSSDVDGLIGMDVVDPDAHIWSITDNALAKVTEMKEYPTQGRHGQGVINLRLPKGASEVVAVVMGGLETNLIITTAIGTTKQFKLGKAAVGSRSIKPRPLWEIGERNRVMGAIRLMSRIEMPGEDGAGDNGETAVPQQLSLIGEVIAQTSPEKQKSKRKKA
jgi:DNA gyrase subunit A